MEKLTFDTGIREYDINGKGVLRFNPSDPNVYERFYQAVDELEQMERELTETDTSGLEGQAIAAENLRLLTEADRKTKQALDRVFGPPNDFNALLEGVNLMAVATNGERVVTNLLAALTPIIEQGAQECARQNADAAVQQATANRAARRAAARGTATK